MLNRLYRIIDANINRASEGLRVLEDLARFYFENSAASQNLKKMRHGIRKNLMSSLSECISERDSQNDIGLPISKVLKLDNKASLTELIAANFKRVQEALRVVEETLKLLGEYEKSKLYEDFRYRSYALEKDFFEISCTADKKQKLDKDLYCLTAVENIYKKGGIHMEVRNIKPEECITASKIQAIAFTTGQDFSLIEADPKKKSEGYETVRAAFSDEGKMCACFNLIPYEVMFDKHTVNMAGIGGVASLPEERHNGYVKEIFKHSFIEMRKNKQWFSYLYPFSHVYYRKFGYEYCYRKTRTTIPVNSFKHFLDIGKVKHYIPGSDHTDIRNIYRKFIEDKNLAVVRNDRLWKKHIEQDTYKNNIYTYVWYTDSGEAKSYITFKTHEKAQYKYDMQVQELIFVDEEGLLGILGFIKNFVSRYENFVLENTYNIRLDLLFPEPYDVSSEISSYGMNRIVDLQEVLNLVQCPEANTTLVFKVNDNFLEWNNGTFVVNWGQNGVDIQKKECKPDLSCSIQVMTQLLTGFTDLNELTWNKDVKIEGNHALLSRLFKKKKLYINDYF